MRLICFLFFFLPALALFGQKEPDCRDMLEKAKTFENKNELSKAVQFYLNALNCNSGLGSEVGPRLKGVFGKIEEQKKQVEVQRDSIRQEREKSELSARANRMAALAMQKANSGDYTLAWHLAVVSWQITWDSLNGGSSEPGVTAIMHDIVSDTAAWFMKSIECDMLVLSPDGQYILTESSDQSVRLWNKSGNLVKILDKYEGGGGLVFSPDSEYLLTMRKDKTVRLWDKKGNLVNTFEGQTSDISLAIFSPDSRYILTVNEDGTVHLWNKDGNFVKTFQGQIGCVSIAQFSSDSQYILTAGEESTVQLWDKNGNLVKTLGDNLDGIALAVFSLNAHFLTVNKDSTAQLWDAKRLF